jgi:hypothetical protein
MQRAEVEMTHTLLGSNGATHLKIIAVAMAGAIAAALVGMNAGMSHARPLGPVQSPSAANGFPAARCSRPADQEALRIKQLAEFVEKSRSMAMRNPLLLADVDYYEAELAASRRCLESVAAR